MTNLISMKYKGKGNIREYVMEQSHLASKLKALKLDLSEELLVHLVLISLPVQYNQFKVSYNCQKETWSLNELIAHCVQEEERSKHDRLRVLTLSNTLTSIRVRKGRPVRKLLLRQSQKRIRIRHHRNPKGQMVAFSVDWKDM